MAADTYSATLGVILMGTGNDNNSWGSNANTLAFQILEDAIANALTSAVTGGTLDLSGSPPPAAATQVRYAALIFTGALGSNQTIQVPNLTKWWYVSNQTSGAFTLKFKTPSGSASTAIPQNSGWQVVMCDGSNGIVVYPHNSKQVQMPDGSVSAPAYSNVTEPSSGLYRAGTQDWRISVNGVDCFQVTGSGAGSPNIVNVPSPSALQQQGNPVTGASGAITTGHLAKWAGATSLSDAGVAGSLANLNTLTAQYLDSSATGMNAPLNLSLSVTKTGGNLLNVAVKTAAGADATSTTPILVNFQTVSGGLTTGGISQVSIQAALSMTSNSTSATLAITNAKACRIWFAIFNNAGTAVLAIMNTQIAGVINAVAEYGVASTTGISSSATSAGVWYTPNGTSLSNCAYRLIGYAEWISNPGLPTAGSFTIAPDNTVIFSPGMKKPGDPVQVAIAQTTSLVVTPSSQVNQLIAQGWMEASGNAATNMTLTLKRAIGAGGASQIGQQGLVFCANNLEQHQVNTNPVFDQPLWGQTAVSNITYSLTSLNVGGGVNWSTIVATEYMG